MRAVPISLILFVVLSFRSSLVSYICIRSECIQTVLGVITVQQVMSRLRVGRVLDVTGCTYPYQLAPSHTLTLTQIGLGMGIRNLISGLVFCGKAGYSIRHSMSQDSASTQGRYIRRFVIL